MKTNLVCLRPARRPREGSAVIVVLAFLVIMMLLVTANTKTVNWVRTEVRLVDQHETTRLATSAGNQTASPVLDKPQPASP